MQSDFGTFAEKLEQYAKGLPNVYQDAIFKAGQFLNAEIPVRVFNEGKDVNGSKRPKGYTEDYKKQRRKKGLQVSTVDLVAEGDLQRSIKLVKSKLETFMQIKGDLNVTKARVNEKRFSSGVFEASKKERIEAVNQIQKEVEKFTKSIFN